MQSRHRSGIIRESRPPVATKTESSPGPTYQTASANLIRSCCEVHGCIFSVITSGVICVIKLCYALRHIRMTCTDSHAHADMHVLHVGLGTHAHATAPAHSTTVLAQARPTMFCIRLVIRHIVYVFSIYLVALFVCGRTEDDDWLGNELRRQSIVKQRDDRRQDNTDRRRLARQHQSDTLRLLRPVKRISKGIRASL